MQVNLSNAININTIEISNEINVIILKTEKVDYLYKLDKFEHECQLVGSFKYIKFINNMLFLKESTTLKIMNSEFKLIHHLQNIDIVNIFYIKDHAHIVSFSRSNFNLAFYNVKEDGKTILLQKVAMNFIPSEIVDLKIGGNNFIAIHIMKSGGTLQFYKLSENLKWKFYTSTAIPELNKIVHLSDDTMVMLLFSHQFKNTLILNVV